MTENNDNPEPKTNNPEQATNEVVLDPLVKIMASLKFNEEFFDNIAKSHNDPEQYAEYFKTPDIYILWNLMWIIADYDPNKDIEGPSKANHDAYFNLVKWMLLKFTTDPQWFSYIGHLMRYLSVHLHPSSYYPLRYSERFVPNHFFTATDNPTIQEVNEQIKKDPREVFKWKTAPKE
jgi:hypothetical protein